MYYSRETNIFDKKFIKTVSSLQLTESTLFPDGSRVIFRCEGPPGLRYSREGNASLSCQDGRWSTRIPFCRATPTRHSFSGKFWNNIRIQ